MFFFHPFEKKLIYCNTAKDYENLLNEYVEKNSYYKFSFEEEIEKFQNTENGFEKF